MRKLNDFGEKIGGAKKDLWASFHELPEEKQNEMAKKDKIWPRPRYDSLNNVERSVLYWRNEMRKAVVSHPQSNASDYVEFCTNFKKAVEKCCSMEDIAEFYREGIKPFMKKIDEKKWKYASKRTKPFFSGIAVLKYANHQDVIASDCSASNFMASREEKEAKKYDIVQATSANTESKPYRNSMFANKVRTSNCIHIFYDKQNFSKMLEDNSILFIPMYDKTRLGVFSSKELADKAITEHKSMTAAKKIGNSKKEAFLPPHLSHIERTGSNYDFFRISDGNILLSRYGLRGGEFGNYTTSKDRMGAINMAYDAFYDLYHAIGISAKDVSLGGELSIAFGARGHGNALAHFEPDRNVINITKIRGAGSLAHEWGHAMDWYIGNKLGLHGFMSDSAESDQVPDTAKELVNSMMYTPDGTETEFYKASKKFDDNYKKTGNGYWASSHEMLARAFACYVLDKLDGRKSDYLVGHAECATNGIDIAYPIKNERKTINENFDKFFEGMVEKGFFTKNTIETDVEKNNENIVEIELELFESQDGQLKFFC